MYNWFADLRFLFYETVLLFEGSDSCRFIHQLELNRVFPESTNILGVFIQYWW